MKENLILTKPQLPAYSNTGAYYIADQLRKRGVEVSVYDVNHHNIHELLPEINASVKRIFLSNTYSSEIQIDRFAEWLKDINPRIEVYYNRRTSANRLTRNNKWQYPAHWQELVHPEQVYKICGATQIHVHDIIHYQHHFHVDDNINHKHAGLIYSEGCQFKCKFCSDPGTGKRAGTYIRKKEYLAEEIALNYQNFGIDHYYITCSTFNETEEKITDFLQAIEMSGVKIKWTSFARLELLNKQTHLVDDLVNSGLLGFQLGIESTNYESAKSIGKFSNMDYLRECLTNLKKIPTLSSNFIFGLPFDDRFRLFNDAFALLDEGLLHSVASTTLTMNDKMFGYEDVVPWIDDLQKHYSFDENNKWILDGVHEDEYEKVTVEFGKQTVQRSGLPCWHLTYLSSKGYALEDLLKVRIIDFINHVSKGDPLLK